jgi:hypothetical protein
MMTKLMKIIVMVEHIIVIFAIHIRITEINTMIKRLTALLAVFFISMTASAQIAKFSAGVKGVGMANLMDNNLMTYGGGGGVFAGVRIADVVGVQAEALYGVSVGTSQYEIANSLNTINLQHNYLYVPVVAQVWCGRNVAFEAGYQQAIVLSGTLRSSYFDKEDTGMFDYGSVIAGIHFNLGKVVTMNFRYAYGLGYSYIATTEPSKNQSVQFGLGFRFFTTRKQIFR